MKEKILKLREDGKTYNEIKKILGCSKGTISYHCKNIIENDKITIKNNKERIYDGSYSKVNINNKDILIKLYDDGVKIIRISEKLNLSRWTINKYLKSIGKIKIDNRSLEEKEIMRKEKNNENTKVWRKKLKKECVDYKGGKCIKCGYEKYLDCLEFHHRIPNQKEFEISKKGWNLEKLKIELDKCDLVCNRCHTEIHVELKQD